MESNKSYVEFFILPFFMKDDSKWFINSFLFFFIYFIGILVNMVITMTICLNAHLHTPMYIFLCNLSFIDICYTSITVPKLLYILLSGNNSISFTQCFIQIYFFFLVDSAEVIVLFIMAYDRYVAICYPLHYHLILNKKVCMIIMVVTWISCALNALLIISSTLTMMFCSSFTIHQFFCDVKALINISCGGAEMFYIILYSECLVIGLCPAICNVMSYVKIIRVILRIKSKDGRRKAFSTCSSHLIVMAIYYGSAVSVYMIPSSGRYKLVEQILTIFYATVVPMVNPFIYSLRNKDIKNSLRKLL